MHDYEHLVGEVGGHWRQRHNSLFLSGISPSPQATSLCSLMRLNRKAKENLNKNLRPLTQGEITSGLVFMLCTRQTSPQE